MKQLMRRRRKINFGPCAPLGDAHFFVLKILAGVELDVGSLDGLVICLVFFSILVNYLSFFRRLVVSELR
jgi:mannose/fructose/N-acetylgalactosamine-specific phosphotransferase system component IID